MEENNNDKSKEIETYLSNHSYLSLATSYKDKPYCCTLKYVSSKYELFFAMFKSSYTSKILERNNIVACTIDEHNINEFIQIVGEVVLLDSKEERKKAGKIRSDIYSNISFWIYSNEVLFFKIRPYKIKYTLGNINNKRTDKFGDSFELIIKN